MLRKCKATIRSHLKGEKDSKHKWSTFVLLGSMLVFSVAKQSMESNWWWLSLSRKLERDNRMYRRLVESATKKKY